MKEHDGYVFPTYNGAKEYVSECFEEGYSNKAIIGMYTYDANQKQMMITHIDTIGYTNDAKKINQLKLFKQ